MAVLVAADWIFPVTSPPIRHGALLVEFDGTGDERVAGMGPRAAMAERHQGLPVFETPPGAVMPGLINAHTHLELATLDRLRADDGYAAWIRRIIAAKEELGPSLIERGVRDAIETMRSHGTVYVGDVANLVSTAPTLVGMDFPATVFQEFIGHDADLLHSDSFRYGACGADPVRMDSVRTDPVRTLCAAHTPFSTGPALLEACARQAADQNVPWSIHLAESKDEGALLRDGSGPLRGLLLDRGVAERDIPVPGCGPVSHLERLGCLDERLIAVHCVEATADDLALLARRGVRPCVCPSSNLHLCKKLPDLAGMLAAGLEPCLGTDSPASGESFNLFREMEILLDASIDPAIILKMATEFGAAALGLGADFGRIEKGNRPALIHMACEFDGRALEDGAAAAAALIRTGASPAGRDRMDAPGLIERVERLVEGLN